MSWVVEAFGRWYPVVYPHRDRAEADRWIAALDPVLEWNGRRVLDVGCGAGRHLAALARHGARAVGLDYSATLLAEARDLRRTEGGRWPLVRGDMRALPFATAAFDVVASFFTSFGYFGPDEDRRVVTEAARALRPGGRHVLDYLNREHVLAHPMRVRETVRGEWSVREAKRIEGGGRRVVKRVEIRRTGAAAGSPPEAEYEEDVTLYPEDEVRAFLEDAGLRERHVWGGYACEAFDPARSPRRIVVSERESG